MTSVISFKAFLYRLLSIRLTLTINRGIDFIARIDSLCTKILDQFRTNHLSNIGKLIASATIRHIQIDWFRNRLLILCLTQITKLQHTSQNPVATFKCTFRIGDRIVLGRGFRQTGNHCHLGKRKFFQAFVVIDFSRCCDAISIFTQENLIHIEG